MTRYSKRNRGKQLATRNCSNIFSQRVSQVFSIYDGRNNFVISLPSSTAHFNWIPHEFSFLLASCLFIKLQQLLTYLLLTHSEPHTCQVRFPLRLFASDQSPNYLTRKTVTISWQEEKIFLDVLWEKKGYLSFQRKCASRICNSMQYAIFSYYFIV